jgi:integrase
MGRTNANGLPMYLRWDKYGYLLDYPVVIGDKKKRRRERLPGYNQLQACKRQAEIVVKLDALARYGYDPDYRLSDAAEELVAHKIAKGKDTETDKQLLHTIQMVLGNQLVCKLTQSRADYLVIQLRIQGPMGRPLKNATINRYLAAFKASTRLAKLNGKVEKDPLAGVKKLEERNERDLHLNRAQFRKLLAELAPHVRPIAKLAYKVGMRRGEILNLTWDRVDLVEGVIHLQADQTKNGYAREVPLSPDLVEMLRGLPRCPESNRVFIYWRPNKDGTMPAVVEKQARTEMKDIKTAFDRAVTKAGFGDFHFHDLRHCAVTNMRRAGVDPVTIMAITGHRSTQMFKRYNTVDLADKLQALRKLAEQDEEQLAA